MALIAVVLGAVVVCTAASATALPVGAVTYAVEGGHIYRLAATPGARPEDVSAELDSVSKGGGDGWLNVSPDGRFLLLSTERFGCAGWACLAVVDGGVSSGAAIHAPAVIHSDGFGAIASGGGLVVYPAAGGPHKEDLWEVRRRAGGWSHPRLLTGGSTAAYNEQPAFAADGSRILFDCGQAPYSAPPTEICSVAASGGTVRIVVPGGPQNALHHADFAPSGGTVFEGDWQGEQIWKLPVGASKPVRVSNVHDDNSPCVLPDGRIVSLWLDRPGNNKGYHELKVMEPDGSRARMLMTGTDVLDVGIGCGA